MSGIVPLTLACLLQAAAYQKIPAPILLGILKTEGGWVGASRPNTDGSHDLGPMQINDRTWVGVLARAQFGGNFTKARYELQYNGCYNVHVGAWIFNQYLHDDHYDFKLAVGHYNSHNPVSMARYQGLFVRAFKALFGRQLAGLAAPPVRTPIPTQAIAQPIPGAVRARFAATRPPATVSAAPVIAVHTAPLVIHPPRRETLRVAASRRPDPAPRIDRVLYAPVLMTGAGLPTQMQTIGQDGVRFLPNRLVPIRAAPRLLPRERVAISR